MLVENTLKLRLIVDDKDKVKFDQFYRRMNTMQHGLNTLGNVASRIAATGLKLLTTQVIAMAGALGLAGREFLRINEKFAQFEITVGSALKSVTAAKDITRELASITARSPIPFQQLAETVQSFAIIPQTRQRLLQQALEGKISEEGFLQDALMTVQSMAAFRPDQGAKGAVFALREAMGGQMRSLFRRFDIPARLLTDISGKTMTELKNNAQWMLDTIGNVFKTIISPQAIEAMARQPALLLQNTMEQLFELPFKYVGDEGAYDALLAKLTKIFDTITEFVTEKFTKDFAPRLSDAFVKGLSAFEDSLQSMMVRFSKAFNVELTGESTVEQVFNLAEKFFTKSFELIPRGVQYIADNADGIVAVLKAIGSIVSAIAKFFSFLNDAVGTKMTTALAIFSPAILRNIGSIVTSLAMVASGGKPWGSYSLGRAAPTQKDLGNLFNANNQYIGNQPVSAGGKTYGNYSFVGAPGSATRSAIMSSVSEAKNPWKYIPQTPWYRSAWSAIRGTPNLDDMFSEGRYVGRRPITVDTGVTRDARGRWLPRRERYRTYTPGASFVGPEGSSARWDIKNSVIASGRIRSYVPMESMWSRAKGLGGRIGGSISGGMSKFAAGVERSMVSFVANTGKAVFNLTKFTLGVAAVTIAIEKLTSLILGWYQRIKREEVSTTKLNQKIFQADEYIKAQTAIDEKTGTSEIEPSQRFRLVEERNKLVEEATKRFSGFDPTKTLFEQLGDLYAATDLADGNVEKYISATKEFFDKMGPAIDDTTRKVLMDRLDEWKKELLKPGANLTKKAIIDIDLKSIFEAAGFNKEDVLDPSSFIDLSKLEAVTNQLRGEGIIELFGLDTLFTFQDRLYKELVSSKRAAQLVTTGESDVISRLSQFKDFPVEKFFMEGMEEQVAKLFKSTEETLKEIGPFKGLTIENIFPELPEGVSSGLLKFEVPNLGEKFNLLENKVIARLEDLGQVGTVLTDATDIIEMGMSDYLDKLALHLDNTLDNANRAIKDVDVGKGDRYGLRTFINQRMAEYLDQVAAGTKEVSEELFFGLLQQVSGLEFYQSLYQGLGNVKATAFSGNIRNEMEALSNAIVPEAQFGIELQDYLKTYSEALTQLNSVDLSLGFEEYNRTLNQLLPKFAASSNKNLKELGERLNKALQSQREDSKLGTTLVQDLQRQMESARSDLQEEFLTSMSGGLLSVLNNFKLVGSTQNLFETRNLNTLLGGLGGMNLTDDMEKQFGDITEKLPALYAKLQDLRLTQAESMLKSEEDLADRAWEAQKVLKEIYALFLRLAGKEGEIATAQYEITRDAEREAAYKRETLNISKALSTISSPLEISDKQQFAFGDAYVSKLNGAKETLAEINIRYSKLQQTEEGQLKIIRERLKAVHEEYANMKEKNSELGRSVLLEAENLKIQREITKEAIKQRELRATFNAFQNFGDIESMAIGRVLPNVLTGETRTFNRPEDLVEVPSPITGGTEKILSESAEKEIIQYSKQMAMTPSLMNLPENRIRQQQQLIDMLPARVAEGDITARQAQAYKIKAELEIDLIKTEETFEGFWKGVEEGFASMYESIQSMSQTMAQSFASGFGQAFADFASGAETAKEAFRKFAYDFLRQVAQMLAQQAAIRVIMAMFGGMNAGGSTALGGTTSFGSSGTGITLQGVSVAPISSGTTYFPGGAEGGLTQTFAKGGKVAAYTAGSVISLRDQPDGGILRGGSGYKDDIPIMAMGNEYIIRKERVKEFGTEFFDKINKEGKIPEIKNMPDTPLDAGPIIKQGQRSMPMFDTSASAGPAGPSGGGEPSKGGIKGPLAMVAGILMQKIVDQRQQMMDSAPYYNGTTSLGTTSPAPMQGYMPSTPQVSAGPAVLPSYEAPEQKEDPYGPTGKYGMGSASIGLFGGALGASGIEPGSALGAVSTFGLLGALFGAKGGKIPQYAKGNVISLRDQPTGGILKGGSKYKDDLPILAMGGEYVINKKRVDQFGKGFFDKLNFEGIVPATRIEEKKEIHENNRLNETFDRQLSKKERIQSFGKDFYSRFVEKNNTLKESKFSQGGYFQNTRNYEIGGNVISNFATGGNIVNDRTKVSLFNDQGSISNSSNLSGFAEGGPIVNFPTPMADGGAIMMPQPVPMASGGSVVGDSSTQVVSNTPVFNVVTNVTLHNNGSATSETETTSSGGNQGDLMAQFSDGVRGVVAEYIAEESRPGRTIDRIMNAKMRR